MRIDQIVQVELCVGGDGGLDGTAIVSVVVVTGTSSSLSITFGGVWLSGIKKKESEYDGGRAIGFRFGGI